MRFQPFLRFYFNADLNTLRKVGVRSFQPFLRFYRRHGTPLQKAGQKCVSTLLEILLGNCTIIYEVDRELCDTVAKARFQPFLRFYTPEDPEYRCGSIYLEFQPFLRFYAERKRFVKVVWHRLSFQPFLRFYRSCVRFLWVFKFFFGFL